MKFWTNDRVEWLKAHGLEEWGDYLDRFYHGTVSPAPIIQPAFGDLNINAETAA